MSERFVQSFHQKISQGLWHSGGWSNRGWQVKLKQNFVVEVCKDLVQRFPAFPCRRQSEQKSHRVRIWTEGHI